MGYLDNSRICAAANFILDNQWSKEGRFNLPFNSRVEAVSSDNYEGQPVLAQSELRLVH